MMSYSSAIKVSTESFDFQLDIQTICHQLAVLNNKLLRREISPELFTEMNTKIIVDMHNRVEQHANQCRRMLETMGQIQNPPFTVGMVVKCFDTIGVVVNVSDDYNHPYPMSIRINNKEQYFTRDGRLFSSTPVPDAIPLTYQPGQSVIWNGQIGRIDSISTEKELDYPITVHFFSGTNRGITIGLFTLDGKGNTNEDTPTLLLA